MKVIFKVSIRNLVRQKQRNLLLGLSIAFGMGVLVLANALGTGIQDLILNKMVEKISGHVVVSVLEKGGPKERRIIRDQEQMKQAILQNIDGVKAIYENVTAHGKALGNGKTEYAAVSGIVPDNAFYSETPVLAGNLADLSNPAIEHPVAVYKAMADKLNVQVYDVMRLKFQNVYGQVQIARFTVVAIIKANNPLLNTMIYCHLDRLKPLMGYQEHETGRLRVILERFTDPKRAIAKANRLHEALHPGAAGYTGTLHADMLDENVTVLAVATDEQSRRLFISQIHAADGSPESMFEDEETLIVSQELAKRLNVRVGDEITFSYQTRFRGVSPVSSGRVGAIFEPNEVMKPDMLFIHPERMYDTFFPAPPQYPAKISSENPLFPSLLKEWTLLERTLNQRESAQKYRELSLSGWQGAVLDVQTVHEVAEGALEITSVITIITFVGVLILFFVIQIGVVNLLRTTIRERTREIGTVRAIGMQRGDVRWCFVTEMLLLTLLASLTGIALAVVCMAIFGAVPIDAGDGEMGFFLINNHLYFVTRMGDLLRNLTVILGIAFLTAYFPARKAVRLSVVEALRHYE